MEARLYKYCPFCGSSMTDVRENGHSRRKCPECGFVQYLNPAPAVGVIVVSDGRVLLVKRKFEPFKGRWVIPSGFVEWDEDVRDTAVRELKEETGLDIKLGNLYTVESCFDDPRGNTILILYMGEVAGGDLVAGDDADDIGYFRLDSLPPIAFEAHRDVLERLKKEMD